MRCQMYKFETASLTIVAYIDYVDGYQYDGDDENGETQRALDNGDLVAFDTTVQVWSKSGQLLGEDHLGSSVYSSGEEHEFFDAHRDADPTNRNCRATNASYQVCHYFPSMVAQACGQAREALGHLRAIRMRTVA